jgi:hypothetical protein
VRHGPVGSLREPEGTESDFARFVAEGITFHVEKRLLSALPPEGGEIRFAMGDYGTTTIELRPSP